jgi:putative lipoprotein
VAATIMGVAATGHAQTPPPQADPWFGTDKALHFAAGAGLGAAGYLSGTLAFEERWVGVVFGAGLGLAVSGAKEGFDAAGLGTPSYKDFLWGVLGTMLGVGVSITFDAALRGPLD